RSRSRRRCARSRSRCGAATARPPGAWSGRGAPRDGRAARPASAARAVPVRARSARSRCCRGLLGLVRCGTYETYGTYGTNGSDEFEDVAELLLLRLKVLSRLVGWRDLERHALDDGQAEAFDGDVLGGVVRHQADLADAEVAKDLRAGAVVADVGGEAELLVRLDRVVSLLLQLVRLQLVH